MEATHSGKKECSEAVAMHREEPHRSLGSHRQAFNSCRWGKSTGHCIQRPSRCQDGERGPLPMLSTHNGVCASWEWEADGEEPRGRPRARRGREDAPNSKPTRKDHPKATEPSATLKP